MIRAVRSNCVIGNQGSAGAQQANGKVRVYVVRVEEKKTCWWVVGGGVRSGTKIQEGIAPAGTQPGQEMWLLGKNVAVTYLEKTS